MKKKSRICYNCKYCTSTEFPNAILCNHPIFKEIKYMDKSSISSAYTNPEVGRVCERLEWKDEI